MAVFSMQHKLIEVKNLTKEYHENSLIIKALNNLSIDIYGGEILGLLGVNGAGKTTLSSILTTLHPASSGDVLFEGESIYKNINKYRKIIGFCPQKPNLIEDLTVRQNLFFAGKFFGLHDKQVNEKLDELVSKYELSMYLDSKPAVLSGGYKQRVLLARSLMHNPKLVILDEPTVGLDPHIRRRLWDNIRNLKKDGITVILTTHYLEEAEILSDRICILHKGSIILLDTPEHIKSTYQKSNLEDVFVQLMEEETKQG
jgi:ABC-2 type transport system ATP-binding protein